MISENAMENRTKIIDEITHSFISHFNALTQEELNRKPDTGTWSIAQNIDHIIVLNESYFPVIDQLHKGTYKPPFLAKAAFLATMTGKLILNFVHPDRKMKMKTFPVWEPHSGTIHDNILERFELHQNELKQRIRNSEDLVKKGAIIASPANRFICYRLGTAFEIMITHEQRHLEQAKELLDSIKASL
jgi:hypothetical protein